MTQVDSGKEEGGHSSSNNCQQHDSSGESGPASHNEDINGKIQNPKKTVPVSGAFTVKAYPPREVSPSDISTFTSKVHNNGPSRAMNTSPGAESSYKKTLRIYRNGDPRDPFDFEYKVELRHSRSWSQTLKMLTSAISMSPRTKTGYSVSNVFTMKGKKVLSLTELDRCNEVVVGAGEAFQSVSYGNTDAADSPSVINNRRHAGNRTFKVRRADRNAIVKSVIFESPLTESEEIGGSQANRKNPLVKTFSEQDVSNYEMRSAVSEAPSPKLRPRSNHSSRPRPVSAAVASVHGGLHGDKRSPMVGLASRIPKRIVSTPNSNNSRGSSPNVCALQHSTPNNPITNNNFNNRNTSRRGLDSKTATTSERASRQDTASRREFIRPRLVTIIRHGMKPRRAVRFLLNKKTARSYDQVLTDITDTIKPDWGAVRKVFTLNGAEVNTLEAFFGTEDIFLASANDRVNPEDFELDFEECKAIQPYVKATLVHKHSRTMTRGLDSKSPQRKSGKGSSSSTPSTAQAAGPSHPKNIPLSHFPSPILDKYEVGGIIGDGNFAVVRECMDSKTKERYALKVIDKSKCNGRDVPPEHEIAILTHVSHPNIIVLYEQYDFSNELYVVMELVEGGDLFDAIADVTKFSERESKSMTSDIASALHYLHIRKIAHRDIKPENLLVYFENDGERRIKLGDFGLAQVVKGPMYTVCGTPTYVAPEILAETGYGTKVDVWALGVIVYVLLCGYPPFVSPTGEQEDLFDLILSGEFEFHPEHWDVVSQDAKDIIGRMIDPDADSRLTAQEVLEHPWLAVTADDREERRRKMFQRDFKFRVFEAMGLSSLDPHKDSSLP